MSALNVTRMFYSKEKYNWSYVLGSSLPLGKWITSSGESTLPEVYFLVSYQLLSSGNAGKNFQKLLHFQRLLKPWIVLYAIHQTIKERYYVNSRLPFNIQNICESEVKDNTFPRMRWWILRQKNLFWSCLFCKGGGGAGAGAGAGADAGAGAGSWHRCCWVLYCPRSLIMACWTEPWAGSPTILSSNPVYST